MAHLYACSVCGEAVEVSIAGGVVRSCPHDGEAVIAERTAVLYGEGHCEPSLVERAVSALLRLIGAR